METTTEWTDSGGVVWEITFTEEAGELRGVKVGSTSDKRLSLTTLRREIPFGDLLDKIRQERLQRTLKDGAQFIDSATGRVWTVRGEDIAVHHDDLPRRRHSMTKALMEEVAEVYSAADAAGVRNPTERVKEHFQVAYPTAARWVMKARREPFNTLPPTTPGKAKGGR